VCRLKFRVTNEVGATVPHDELFAMRGNHVHAVRGNSSEAGAMRKYFPDNSGQP
jgi:hypothetical protein